jgi:uncharacterized protein
MPINADAKNAPVIGGVRLMKRLNICPIIGEAGEKMIIKKRISYKDHDIFLIPTENGTFLLYAPTLKKIIRITKELASQISNVTIEDESKKYNQDVYNIFSILSESIKDAIKPFPMDSGNSKYFHLSFGLTRNCSLGCLYCHADSGNKEDMPLELMEESVNYAFESAQRRMLKRININLAVGGEPTTNWELFTSCIKKIKKSEAEYSIPTYLTTTTNGFYGANKRHYIAKYFDNILLSLDGPPDIQNFHRPTNNGADSFPFVRDSALFFKDNIKSFGIRSTISNYSVKRMPEIVEFFYNEFGKGFEIVFEPLVPIGRAKNNSLLKDPLQTDFVKYYIKSKIIAKLLGIKILTSADNHKRLVTGFCGAMFTPAFSVTPKGIVTTCSRDSDGEDYGYGKFAGSPLKFILDKKRDEQNKSFRGLPKKCHDCFCKWHCAGDCPDVRTVKYNRCHMVKELVKHSLETRLNESVQINRQIRPQESAL